MLLNMLIILVLKTAIIDLLAHRKFMNLFFDCKLHLIHSYQLTR